MSDSQLLELAGQLHGYFTTAQAEAARISRRALVGRLLQSHFSQDYTFAMPLDIEWVIDGKSLYILQIRPYAG